MLPFTLDNNLVFTYGGEPFAWDKKDEFTRLECQYAKATRTPTNFKDECIRTCLLLAEQAKSLNRTPTLLLSGGLDSEVIARAMREAGVEFRAVTFKFPDRTNAHELVYVRALAKELELDVEYFDIDIAEWIYSDEALDMVKDSGCDYYEMLPHMKLIEHVWETNGLPILGNGDVYARKDINPIWRMTGVGDKHIWNYIEYEYILAWFRFAIKRNILGGLAFFQHTPEITLSMLNEPLMKACLTNQLPYKMSSRTTKYQVYKQHWPNIVERPKFNGGELLHGLFNDARDRNKFLALPTYDDEWQISIDEFYNVHQTTNT